MTDAPVLDQALMERLRGLWVEQGAPIAERLRPGLSDAEMDELTAPLGLTLPPEARTWWRFADGATEDVPSGARVVGTGYFHMPLVECVSWTAFKRGFGLELSGVPIWRDCFLTVTKSSSGTVVVDCDERAEVSPVRYLESHDIPDLTPAAESLGEMVSWWIEGIEAGYAAYDRQLGRWRYDYDVVPRERELTRLI